MNQLVGINHKVQGPRWYNLSQAWINRKGGLAAAWRSSQGPLKNDMNNHCCWTHSLLSQPSIVTLCKLRGIIARGAALLRLTEWRTTSHWSNSPYVSITSCTTASVSYSDYETVNGQCGSNDGEQLPFTHDRRLSFGVYVDDQMIRCTGLVSDGEFCQLGIGSTPLHIKK